jgi:DNA-binding PadR family transcriptional regulator
MSIRKKMLPAIARNGQLTQQELSDAIGEDLKRIKDNINAAKTEGLVDRVRDDVTGLPAYTLTEKGKKWVADNGGTVEAVTDAVDPVVTMNKPEVSTTPRAELDQFREATKLVDDLKRQLHDQGNDLAGMRMILDEAVKRIGAAGPTDFLTVLDARLARPAQLGRPALILVDGDNAEVLDLPQSIDPKARAMELVMSGGITTAIVATIHGRATMPKPTPEWLPA